MKTSNKIPEDWMTITTSFDVDFLGLPKNRKKSKDHMMFMLNLVNKKSNT